MSSNPTQLSLFNVDRRLKILEEAPRPEITQVAPAQGHSFCQLDLFRAAALAGILASDLSSRAPDKVVETAEMYAQAYKKLLTR